MHLIKPLVVSLGEPAGIGPDIILKAFMKREALDLPFFYVTGSADLLQERARLLGIPVRIKAVSSSQEAFREGKGVLSVIDVASLPLIQPGVIEPGHEAFVVAAIRRAVVDVVKGEARGLITGPIHKASLMGDGFAFTGHTDFLGALANEFYQDDSKSFFPVMMLAAKEMKVVPLTVHVPLKEVFGLLTKTLITRTIQIVAGDLKKRFGISSPRIGITGLNPHAGEDGQLGSEEIEIIEPAVRALCDQGFDVSGPIAADTAFTPTSLSEFDVMVAIYHDQALIPIKTVAFDKGVNVTLGLPFIRTSPDHGTALSLAGHGTARPDSFIEALIMASEMAKHEAGSTLADHQVP